MYTNYRYKIVETSTYAILKEDAVVSNGNEIVIPSSGETSVDIARASWIAQKGIIIGSDLNIIRPTSSVHPLFLALSLSNNQVKYNLAKVAQGNSIVHLYNNNLKKVNIYFPNIVEQNRIGNILNSISNCINLHERKCEELALIKKALLQKLFPKKDEFKPEVRYKNFSDAWEQRKLGEILSDLYNGQTPSRNVKSYWKGDIPWLTSGELNHGIVEETIEKISESGKKAANLRLIPSGTIVIAITGLEAPGTRGNCAILGIDTTVNQSVMALVVKNNIDTQFIFQWYKKIGEEYGIRYTQGTKQQSYNYDLVKILPITIPTTTEEQQKIGSFFNQLDSLIALHQRKLEKLKQLKKFL